MNPNGTLTSLEQNLSNAYEAIATKGGAQPQHRNFENLAATIQTISGFDPTKQHVVAKFNAAFGSPDYPSQVVAYSGRVTRPSQDPTKPESEFIGWYEQGEAPEIVGNIIAMFRAVEGDNHPESQFVLQGELIKDPGDSHRDDGYDFMGWYNAGDTYPQPKGEVLLSFRTSDDVASVPGQILYEGESGTEPQTPTRDGYTFDGWHKIGELSDAPQPQELVVTFGGADQEPQNVAPGALADTPPTPTKEGYEFLGWYQRGDIPDGWDGRDII